MIDFVKKILTYKSKGVVLMSFLFTGLYYYGDVILYDEKYFNIKYIFILLGYMLLFKTYYYLVSEKTEKDYIIPYFNFKNLFIYFFIIYIIHALIKYPIALDCDSFMQLEQGLGYESLTTHWPLFHTLLLTWFYRFGTLLGNHNIGIFIFSIIQTIYYSFISAYVINSLYKMQFNKYVVVLSIIFLSFNPMVASVNGTALKDGNYSAALLLFCALLAKYLFDSHDFINSKKDLMLLFASCFFLHQFRNNGVYVYFPTLLIMLVMEKKRTKNLNIRLLSFAICTLLVSILFSNTLQSIYNAKDGSRREMFSLPFQQTARLITFHEELITSEEKQIINAVLDYDLIAQNYTDFSSDPVKILFKDEATTKELFDYFVVWFKEFFRSPLTYVEATSIQNIYLVYPRLNLFHYNVDCNGGSVGNNQELGFLQTPLWLKNNQHYYFSVLILLHTIPVINILSNPAIYNILLIYSIYFEATRKDKKMLIFVPLILSLLIVIAGPCIIGNPRYMYPVVWTAPIWIGILSKKYTNSDNNNISV